MSLLSKEPQVYGTWSVIPSPEVVNVIAKAGLDFVYLDLEHGISDFITLQRMIVSAQSENCCAIVRVADNSPSEILKVLDSGANGVLIPHVNSKSECDNALNAIYYQPLGDRGYSPYTRAGGYQVTKEYTENSNKNIISGIIIEGETATMDISSIIDDSRLDFIYIGTYDISVFLGIPGQTKHKSVVDVVRRCVSTAKRFNKGISCLFHDKNEKDFFIELGINMLTYKVDSSVLFDSYSVVGSN
jgi:2-keto-3-deoxy-L-rhamnonate aldolase RhmA